MEINYHVNEEDYLQFNMFHIKQSDSAMKTLKVQRFIMPFVYVLFAYLFALITDIPFIFTFIPFFIMGLLWMIFYPRYFYRNIIKQTKKMVREGSNEGLLGDRLMTLSDEGIVEAVSNGETKVKWSGITGFKEDDERFYLYNSSVSAYIIPKRDIEHVERIREYVKSKLQTSSAD